MNVIKKILILEIIIVTTVIFSLSCNSVKTIHITDNIQYPILDSLSYVVFPDDNYGTEGNYYFKKITSYKENIVPCLIDKITDTLTTNIRIADVFNLKNGDIAVYLLPYVCNEEIPMRAILFDEFKELKNKNLESDFFDSIYYRLFLLNSDKKNYKNRVRFYKRIKKWYEEKSIHYKCFEKNQFLLDSMQYIYALPDDYFFSPKGDSICERIINKGSSIIPCLIDKITDDTKTKIRIADYYDYEVGDAAVFLLLNIYSLENRTIPLRKMIVSEFYNNEEEEDFFETLYHITFLSHSKEVNQRNKYRLQELIKEWYLNNKDGILIKKSHE